MDCTGGIEILSKLGEGSYGAVHKAKVISSGLVVAVKVIELH